MPSGEADNKRAVGVCSFFLLFIISTTAFALSMTSIGYCAFVNRDITFAESVEQICNDTSLTSDQQKSCPVLLQNHGVGFWGWQGTIPVDQVVCFSYTQYVPGYGYVTPWVDSYFNAALAFAFLASFFGMMAWATLAISSCCPLSGGRMKCLAIYFFLAFLSQALTFLIFSSNVCKKDFFAPYFQGIPGASLDLVKSVSCSLSKGSNIAVAATVLYFVCMLIVPKASPPNPIPFPGEEERPLQEEVQEE